MQTNKQRIAVALLTLSAVGFTAWQSSEGFTANPVIPTKGDVPTIGHGSTRYENGTPVKMTDKPITRERGAILALNLNDQEEAKFRASLPGAKLHPEEFDLYMDFIGQYGMTTWKSSSMRRDILAGNYAAACHDLLKYRYAAGFDCSTPGNKRCMGVWTRQLERHNQCMEVQ